MIIRIAVLAQLLSAFLANENAPVISTSYGTLRGYYASSSDGVQVSVFKSVPFTTAPVGSLRWKLPEAPLRWTGVRDGTRYSAACMSNSTTSSSPQEWVDEDCLYLNYFVPSHCSARLFHSRIDKRSRCPIIVYFHGGGMNYDSATYFNDTSIIDNFAAKGVIFVISAFRLGFTGQFQLGELIPSNLGMHDALLALKFIEEQANVFGGAADEITLMGHSSGGEMVTLLAFSPVVQKEVSVRRLIAMSAAAVSTTQAAIANMSAAMIARAGCANSSQEWTLDCMKKMSGQELLAIQRSMEEEDPNIVFGNFIIEPPLFPFKNWPDMMRNAPKADIVIGTTCKEMDNGEVDKIGAGLGSFMGLRNIYDLDQIYLNLTASGKLNIPHSLSSQAYYIPSYLTAKAIIEKGNKAFVYSFDQTTRNTHSEDISYVMGIHPFEKNENELVIAQFYPQLFLNFSKFGTPSPAWKPMGMTDNYFSIAVNITSGRMPENRAFYEKDTIDFWVRKAPRIDKLITVTSATGGKMEYDKNTKGFRNFAIEDDNTTAENDTLIPVIVVHSSYLPSIFILFSVLFLGIIIGRFLLGDTSSIDERKWILGGDGSAFRVDRNELPVYAEKMF